MIIVTRYNEQYEAYKPFWEYCIEKAYPEYSYHACLSTYPAIDRLLIDPYPSEYSDMLQTVYHKYHYITDIDMMILREEVSIKEFHLREMESEGLCYSNSGRGPSEAKGLERITGLHFVELRWFDITKNARIKYQALANKGIFTEKIDDELILKNIIIESGLALPRKKSLIARHHGIHFGTGRTYKGDRKRRFEQLRLRISPEKADQWQVLISDPHFKSLVNKAPEWLQDEMMEMHIFTRTRAKQCL